MTDDETPRADELRDAERLRRFVEGDGAAATAPPAADAEVVGLFAEATGAVPLPEAAWQRIAAGDPGQRRAATAGGARRTPWTTALALAAAVLVALGAVALWPGGEPPIPGPTLAELETLGSALAQRDLAPSVRLAALGRVADAGRRRLVQELPDGR